MKLYYSPGACSLGIHILLQEIGAPYELARVDFAQKQQYSADYTAINPKSKVPLLELDDGSTISEFPAIAWYLAAANPALNLAPPGMVAQVRMMEAFDYLIGTMHMRGFTRIFRPEMFSPTAADKAAVQAAGRDIAAKGFAILAPQLGEQDYFFGDFSIIDCALFFLEFWAETRAGVALPESFAAHLRRMRARPAVAHVLAAEGLG